MIVYIDGLVSVIIPTYRRSEFLSKAILSVLGQTYTNLEVLVVNDNIPGDKYSEELCRIISLIKDKRLFLIEQDKHINGAAARNVGIRKAVGEYIAFLDDDDYWEKDKIEIQVAMLNSLSPEWGAVSCLNRAYKNGLLTRCSLPHKSGFIFREILERRISLTMGSVLIKRSALDDSGYFDEGLSRHQDLQLFARLSYKYKIRLIKRYLYNIELKDRSNQPSAENLIAIKKAYFHSINDLLNTLTESEIKIVKSMHRMEIANAFLRERRKAEGVRQIIGLLSNPLIAYYVLERLFKKIIMNKCRFLLQRKYGS